MEKKYNRDGRIPWVERHDHKEIGRIPMEECIPRRIYWLNCRNLGLGVYDGEEGFIGIRTKFGSRYLFTEYHWDQGPPYGTVRGQEDTGVDLPDNIPLKEHLGTVGRISRRPAHFEEDKGWWVYDDDGARLDDGDAACFVRNAKLFEFLDNFQKGEKDNG